MIRKLILLTALAAVWPAAAQQTRILNAERHNEYGLVYTLPTTALRITATARRDVRRAGPYCLYAAKSIGTDRVVNRDEEVWTLQKIEITPIGIPDPEQQYLMQLKPGALTYIGVDADGMLLSINCAPPEEAPAAALLSPEPLEPYSGKEYLEYVNEDFLASQSSALQARLLKENLLEVRDARIALTRGTAETMPSDGRQLELMLENLKRQEETLTAAFTGTVQSETVTSVFTFTPDEPGSTVLFRFSDFAGFVDADDLSGAPVTINVETVETPSLPVDAKGEEKKLPKDAVIYTIPGTASVSIEHDGRTLLKRDVQLAQYGINFGLDPRMFTDKKAPAAAVFNPATGALTRITEKRD